MKIEAKVLESIPDVSYGDIICQHGEKYIASGDCDSYEEIMSVCGEWFIFDDVTVVRLS